jgi:hypothetical protein
MAKKHIRKWHKKTSVGNGKNHQNSFLQNKNISGNGFCKKNLCRKPVLYIFPPNLKKTCQEKGFLKTYQEKAKNLHFFGKKNSKKHIRKRRKKNSAGKGENLHSRGIC